MIQMNITKMSSKGQIVIPKELRKGIQEGEEIVIIKRGSQIILKRVKDFDKQLKEDLIFAKRTEEAWKKYEKGEFIEMEMDEFLKELKRW
ncbi:MAG TPA: AbrB/MazE/SpoVT family DNA-binding domain-containing protein [Candidatus Nanoarchaeia archaeon]|nr:AbrB/MazE/SpoVT family DNA-binding domain-containing protein [Candidatus Nanoarchaeia archaeon]